VLKIIETSKKYTEDINFIGLIMPNFNFRTEYNLEDVINIDNTLEEICKNNNLNYIKLIDLINNDELTDGLHPNSIGHKKISERILNGIYEV
jgi:lysophospholipase L1-like esterase